MKASEALREFANWRLQTYARRPRESVRFFRSSLDHSMVWMLVMRGHYDNNPPTVGECQDIARCSRLTTRKLIGDAVAKGLLEVRSAPDDHRKRIVCPTERTVAEYADMVRGYLSFFETIGSGEGRSDADRSHHGILAKSSP
jgi:DNA-binding MarR family transcriptional regulator